MTLRDVLQIEIWSKQTSRRIWKVAAISFVSVVVFGVAVFAVETKWMTSQEKSAAKIALADIEALQQASNRTSQEYKIAKDRAEDSVAKAQEAKRTLRDDSISNALSFCLFVTDSQHFEPIAHAKIEEFYRLHPERRHPVSQDDLAREQTVNLMMQQMRDHYRDALHRSLD